MFFTPFSPSQVRKIKENRLLSFFPSPPPLAWLNFPFFQSAPISLFSNNQFLLFLSFFSFSHFRNAGRSGVMLPTLSSFSCPPLIGEAVFKRWCPFSLPLLREYPGTAGSSLLSLSSILSLFPAPLNELALFLFSSSSFL